MVLRANLSANSLPRQLELELLCDVAPFDYICFAGMENSGRCSDTHASISKPHSWSLLVLSQLVRFVSHVFAGMENLARCPDPRTFLDMLHHLEALGVVAACATCVACLCRHGEPGAVS